MGREYRTLFATPCLSRLPPNLLRLLRAVSGGAAGFSDPPPPPEPHPALGRSVSGYLTRPGYPLLNYGTLYTASLRLRLVTRYAWELNAGLMGYYAWVMGKSPAVINQFKLL